MIIHQAIAQSPNGYRRGRTDYEAIRDEANNPATAPVEVPMKELEEMLGCVPPIYVNGGFLVGEAMTEDARGIVYAHYARRGEKAFARYAVCGKPETYITHIDCANSLMEA